MTVDVIVRRDYVRGTAVKEDDDDVWSSDGMVLWLGRRKMEMRLSGGESDKG
jgi:hypothetical protein